MAAQRRADCGTTEARVRLKQAQAFQEVAELVLDGEDQLATPQVAAALAVLGGIASSDASCCAALGVRNRSQNHRDAIDMLGTVRPPAGLEMAKDLRRLLDLKDKAHYGAELVSLTEASRAVAWSRRLLDAAARIV